jgi:hypothetical protein
MALPGGRNQDVNDIGDRSPDAVVAHRRRTRDHAAAARIQQGRHLLLKCRRRPRHGDINARQQPVPGPPITKAVLQRVARQACSYCLLAGNHVKLLFQDPLEPVT